MGFFDWQAPDSDSVNFKQIGKQLAAGSPVSAGIARGAHHAFGDGARPIENTITPGAVATGQSETQQESHGPAAPLPPGYKRGTMGAIVKDDKYVDPNAPIAPGAAPYDPAHPFGGNVDDMSKYLAAQRAKDVASGMEFAGGQFGQGNAQIAEVERRQHDRAFNGMSPEERAAYNDQASRGINQQMSTGLRQLRGALSTNGVHGGAAAGAAIPILSNANSARATAASNLNLADMQVRDKALNDYKNTLTGEREGQLGTAYGFAGLGAADRANALQYGLGQSNLNAAQAGQVGMPTPSESKPWWQI